MPELAPFPVQPELTAISLAYTNGEFIADQVLRRVPVGAKVFKYSEWDTREKFQIPETLVGRKGRPKEVEFTATEKTGSVNDHALDDVVPNEDVKLAENAPGFTPIEDAVEMTTELLMLAREKRVANLVFNANTYGANNKATLSGTSKWSDPASDPIRAILEARDSMLTGANTLVLGQEVYTALRLNPAIVKASHGNSGDSGVAARQAIAELLEVDNIIVGKASHDNANPGQAANMTRLWGNFASLIYLNPNAKPNKGMTFGLTAEWGGRISGQINEPTTGMRGSQRVRVGESINEIIMAADAGYLFISPK